MGIFDVFTGAPAVNASNANKDILRFVDDRGRNDITGAADQGLNALNAGYGNARADLSTAYNPLAALSGKYGAATSLGLDATGANGAAGYANALANFKNSPAYTFNLTQGLEAINRRRAAGGMLDSGNADREAQTFGAGLASNEYNNWLNNLLGFTNPELNATGAASGVAKTQAASDIGQGQNLASLYQQAAGARTGLDQSLVGPYTNQNTNAAQAELQGSKNLWGLGLAGAQLAAGLPPGSISGLFGGGSGAAAANSGLAGGGYYGAGGNLYAGPGNYGPQQSDPLGWLRNAWA